MKRTGIIGVALLSAIVGYAAGFATLWGNDFNAVERVVAKSWGDGEGMKLFYGAEVYLVPTGNQFSVRGRIWIGPGNSMWDDLGELGVATTHEQAIENWSQIEWSDAGVTIGPGNGKPFICPRARLEAHR